MKARTPAEAMDFILGHSIRNPRTGCLVFQGSRCSKGYGSVRYAGRMIRAHRIVLFKGVMPPAGTGPHALHTCDNPACVEESHIYAGSNGQNIQDKLLRDRSGKKLRIAKVRRIKQMLADGASQQRIADAHHVHQTTISRINTGARWSHVGGL